MHSFLHVILNGIFKVSPALASQTLFSLAAMVMAAFSESVTDTGTSATSRDFGNSLGAYSTGHSMEARRHGRVTVVPLMLARPNIFAIENAGLAFASALMNIMPCTLPAGIFKPLAVTPGGKPSMPSSMSPSKPSRLTTTTSNAIVTPARKATGLEMVPKSFWRTDMCAAQAASLKSCAARLTMSR